MGGNSWLGMAWNNCQANLLTASVLAWLLLIPLSRPGTMITLFCRHILAMTHASPQEVGFCPHFDTSNWPVAHDQQRITVASRVISFNPSKPIHIHYSWFYWEMHICFRRTHQRRCMLRVTIEHAC
ncbi:uncharacterized protein EI90DRAFT_462380 [Cantharellus anzutake]|uniref:uncharacterized protein n=1 Tax=Cantharellus anzutake TaxID=1750568 RepID=UPI001905753E|nr:uncharacterized protein EI90DRAFT_462380 [Cantharellus anzutake]KAF8334775.1 hypothetical protein EI90DRAFT_462380 [Cantharellus anzutake]